MRFILIVVLAIFFSACSACSESEDNPIILNDKQLEQKPDKKLVKEELSEAEIVNLLFLREEEKLARDVYLYSYDKYKKNIFKNISESEQLHMDAVLLLINKYQLKDPVLDDLGKFFNTDLQNLYDYLIDDLSSISIDGALTAGAIIEDYDIHDISLFEELTEKQDIDKVLANLKCGSKNHLRSFIYQLNLKSIDYEPTYISMEYFNEIINSDYENCGKN